MAARRIPPAQRLLARLPTLIPVHHHLGPRQKWERSASLPYHLVVRFPLAVSLALGCAHANPVLEWNAAFLDCVRKEMPPPCLVARNLAILHLAMHVAVSNAIEGHFPDGEIETAARAAGDEVCRTLFPTHTGEFARANPATDLSAKRAAILVGQRAAQLILESRKNDGSTTVIAYVPSEQPGQWRRTEPRSRPPELPQWGRVQPFLMESGAQFRPPPPPALASEEYAQEVNEVKRLGAATGSSRTEEQTLVARFWSDFSYTESPPGHWNSIASSLAKKRNLSVKETARLFALLNVAMADAGIAVWEGKYEYNLWRPITAIRRADEDGNAATAPDAQWMSLLASPPHPEYVSGHAGFSGAAARILAACFGGDALEFEAKSDSLPGVVRRFSSLQTCAEEIARSRVYGGIHYGMSGRRGLALGRQIADRTIEKFDGFAAGLTDLPHHETETQPAAARHP